MQVSIHLISEALPALDVDDAISECASRQCSAYSEIFHTRRKTSESTGDIASAEAWWFLFQLTRMRLDENDAGTPFKPFAVLDGRMSVVPKDLDNETREAVHALANKTLDPELRARLLDIVWESGSVYTAARRAVESYVESARRVLDADHWPPYVRRCKRALRLAKQTGQSDLQAMVLAEVEKTVLEVDGEDRLFLTIRLMELLIESKASDPRAMAAIAEKSAGLSEERRDFEKARCHLDNLAQWYRLIGDKDEERRARIRIAASLEQQGILSGDGGITAYWLEKAHEAYRSIPGTKDKTAQVYQRLRSAQRESADSRPMGDSGDIDVTEQVEWSRQQVSGLSFPESFWKLVTIIEPTDFEDADRVVSETMDDGVWWRISERVFMETDGRVVNRSGPPLSEDHSHRDRMLQDFVVEVVCHRHRIEGWAFVKPAVHQIIWEHAPQLGDVLELVGHSSRIPTDRQELFAKGILAGLRADFPQALSILVPQLENLLRHLLEQSGVETSRRDKMGHQDVYQLGSILSDDNLEKLLPSDVVRELRVIFQHRNGLKLRDKIAHGLMSSADFYAGISMYAWWLICYVTFVPIVSESEGFIDVPPDGRDAVDA